MARSHSVSERITSASISCVKRGRLRRDTATPPTMMAWAGMASSHFSKSASGVSSLAGIGSDIECFANSRPAFTDFLGPTLSIGIDIEQLTGTDESAELTQPCFHRTVSMLAGFQPPDAFPTVKKT